MVAAEGEDEVVEEAEDSIMEEATDKEVNTDVFPLRFIADVEGFTAS